MHDPVLCQRRFINNTASTNGGGGVYVYTLQTMTVNNVTFSGNTASGSGGALETVCRTMAWLISPCELTMLQAALEAHFVLRRQWPRLYPLWTRCLKTAQLRPVEDGRDMALPPLPSQTACSATILHQSVR